MPDTLLQLAYDDGDPNWFALRELDAVAGQLKAVRLLASNGFSLEQLREALLATGSVVRDHDRLLLQHGTTATALRQIVGEMFEYFSAPNTPTAELLDIQTKVNTIPVVQESAVKMPVFAYAWLDIMVREELADAARCASDVWARSHLEVDIGEVCQRRVEQLVRRYERDSIRSSRTRMAASGRRRLQDDESSQLG